MSLQISINVFNIIHLRQCNLYCNCGLCHTYIIIKNPFTRVKTFQIKANVDNRNEANLALELVFPTTHRVNEFFAGSVRYKIGFYEGGHILYFFVVQRKHMFLLTYSKQSRMFLNGNIHMAQNHLYPVLFNSKNCLICIKILNSVISNYELFYTTVMPQQHLYKL